MSASIRKWTFTLALASASAMACGGKDVVQTMQPFAPPRAGARAPFAAGAGRSGGGGAAGSAGAPARVAEFVSSTPEGCARPYVQVSAGDDHTCALDQTGCLVCWGKNVEHFGDDVGQARPPQGRFVFVSAGAEHTCAIGVDGSLQCWGAFPPAPQGSFTAVTADRITCALHDDGRGTCWGNDAPALPDDARFKWLAAGEYHACGIKLNDTVECWGEYNAGPDYLTRSYAQIAAGDRETCGVRPDGMIECPGWLLGFSVPNGEFSQLDVGSGLACAVRIDGVVRCWGNPSTSDFQVPEGRFVQVSVGGHMSSSDSGHACAIDEAGALHCWGSNLYGQSTVPER